MVIDNCITLTFDWVFKLKNVFLMLNEVTLKIKIIQCCNTSNTETPVGQCEYLKTWHDKWDNEGAVVYLVNNQVYTSISIYI